MSSIYDIKLKDINGKETTLAPYKGKLLLIVNLASKCGYTPQYEGLENMYKKLQDNAVVLGFPCNQFGGQEPGDEQEIKNFCSLTYGVSFPLFSKIDVNGPNAHPLYQHLKQELPGLLGTKDIKWNFTKFLIGRNGEGLKRYAPLDTPEKIQSDVEKLIHSQ